MRAWIVWCARTTFAVLVVASCGTDRREPASGPTDSPSTPTAVSRSDAARARVSALRRRFHVTPAAWPDLTEHEPLPTPAPRPVIGEAAATSFEATAAGSLRAVLPHEAKRAVLRAASVELPLRADAMARVEDDATHVSIGFALRDASAAPIAVADGIAIYAGALAGSDVVHRVHAEGTEDFVVFEAKPAREELVYEVEVSRVAGLRLVNGTLEFLDEGGAPRLRVAPPYVVDESGTQSAATIAVLGCAHDTDPSAPWGRPVTRAGASRCEVRVAWHGTGYPLLVDPSWTVTGSMTTARYRHTATLLASGKVLIVGGNIGGVITNGAEFFDGSSSFAATGWMTTPRENHTATLLPSGKVLIAGGNTDAALPLSSAALFDGIGSFVNTGSMTAPRLEHTATLLPSGKVLIAGGRNKVAFEASADEREVRGLISMMTTRPVFGQCANWMFVPPMTPMASTMR